MEDQELARNDVKWLKSTRVFSLDDWSRWTGHTQKRQTSQALLAFEIIFGYNELPQWALCVLSWVCLLLIQMPR